MEIKSKILGAVVLVILFGAIVLTTVMGWWTTSTSKTPAVIETGEAAGAYDPADIRGSYTLADVNSAFGVPVEMLAAAFQVPDDGTAAGFQIKNLAALYGSEEGTDTEVGTASVRLFVALYAGLPFELEGEEIYMPRSAVNILLDQAQLTPEQRDYLETHTLDVSAP